MKLSQKNQILENLCYTDLVYSRINKKLSTKLGRQAIEILIYKTISNTPISLFKRKGKNIYVLNKPSAISVTINSHTNKVITVNRLSTK